MKLPGWTGTVLHALGGAVITGAAVLIGIPGWLPVLLVGVAGWLREVWQHDLRLTLHQWIEALAWGVGSALSWAVVEGLI
jgi:hypothetical protein